ncbi:GNAT family N-acetyltransferase [Pseudokineococcus basanitobsidens]|uniref:GNAT family N-acetyltransferase n=1 Tax=Pseudokineococcus basanitobsidens TaxID=1926649 RepID=UPI0030D83C51
MTVLETACDDPGLAAGYDDWWAALDAGLRHDLPTASVWPRSEARLQLAHPVPWEEMRVLRAVDGGGAVVGAGYVDVPLRDNLDLVSADLAVPPAHRGRGVGAALARAVCDVAERLGRPRVLGEVALPLGQDPATWPGTAATRRWGATLGVADVRRELPLPPDARALRDLDRLRTDALRHAGGYRWEVLRGAPSPQDAVAVAALSSRMLLEAPQDDLVVGPEDVDADRVLARHARGERLGRRTWTALARRDDGVVAAYSVLQRSDHEPDVLRQEDTLVLPEHRGHRLGLLLKLATLDAALAEGRAQGWSSGLRLVRTWNAASNGPMVAVNEAMGFRPVEELHEVQADVAAVRAAVGRG